MKQIIILTIGLLLMIQLASAENQAFGIGYFGIGYFGIGDNESPTWVIEPVNQTIEVGVALSYDIEATDDSGIANYTINDTSNFSIDNNGLITNNSVLIENQTYLVNISATDEVGNVLWKVISITVIPPIPLVQQNEFIIWGYNSTRFMVFATMWVNNTMLLNPINISASCNTVGLVHFNSVINEPCYCNGSSYVQFDGGGTC
jgi:hypothetical protein